jgi:RNA polymerase sigma-70 factor (ECF subfamily)
MKQMSSGAIGNLAQDLAGTLDFEANFEAIVAGYRPRIFRFALASLRDRDAAETIVQDCFLRAWKAQHSFRYDCSLQTWLMQITVNLVRDYQRNRRLQFWKRALPVPDHSEMEKSYVSPERSPEMTVLSKQQLNAVWSAAAALPERQRTVLLLRFVEDMDILEIAAAAGMKEGTVKSHLFRALETLRGKMGVRS